MIPRCSSSKLRCWIASIGVAALLSNTPQILGQGHSPIEAEQRFTCAPGFTAFLYASEPLVVQPVCIEFDDRGRLWVIQYIQYPNPAGLTRAKVDRWSRTTYDRAPEPPPLGPKGADRITILLDADGDQRADEAKDFVSGLNLASGLAFGHGGVFVLNVPYLLFYPDRNGDDTPDRDPDVLLAGFGMEDAHSVANSLAWGPDGWLYGCQGSTVTSNIRGIEFQQGVWRYHPASRRFELFCEGGGNSWGLDFDADGELIYSTNVGGYRMLHGVPGAYYWKSFGKHGAHHNPYAFGYFDHVTHRNFTGGHVAAGGVFCLGDAFPASFQGRYVYADLLDHTVRWCSLEPIGSTFQSVEGGVLFNPHDTWSAPCDVTVGPDGAIYVADWFDPRTAHPDPDATWDRSNGRIYRIAPVEPGGTNPAPSSKQQPVNFQSLSTEQLLARLGDAGWASRKARRVLSERRDPGSIPALLSLIEEPPNEAAALEALWALHGCGGWNEALASQWLQHERRPMRAWTIRFLGEGGNVSTSMASQLADLASTESDLRVLRELACTARRLPADAAWPILRALILRNLDGGDPHLPLLVWWAVEHHCLTAIEPMLDFFASAPAWESGLGREAILERLMRRYASDNTEPAWTACARLLAAAPNEAGRSKMLAGLEAGWRSNPIETVVPGQGGLFQNVALAETTGPSKPVRAFELPNLLKHRILSLWEDQTRDPVLIRIAVSLGFPAAQDRACSLVGDPSLEEKTRVALLRCLGEIGNGRAVSILLDCLSITESEAVQSAALEALAALDHPGVAESLLSRYQMGSAQSRGRIRETLLNRPDWAAHFLRHVDAGKLDPKEVPLSQLRLAARHGRLEIDQLVRKHWGSLSPGTAEEKLAEMRRLQNDLRAGAGDASRGRELFRVHCAVCHRLHGEGGDTGPDLTYANRKDREFLLASLVDPSAVIRREYLGYDIKLNDGRVLTGRMVEQPAGGLVIATAASERLSFAQDQVESIAEARLSLMPEGLLANLTPQELRDLFRYLENDLPPSTQEKP